MTLDELHALQFPAALRARQVADAAALAGKTIATAAGGADDDTVGLAFTDGTYYVLQACRTFDAATLARPDPPRPRALLDLGLLTWEEATRIEAEAGAAGRRYLAEIDRETYERLKVRFEGAPQ